MILSFSCRMRCRTIWNYTKYFLLDSIVNWFITFYDPTKIPYYNNDTNLLLLQQVSLPAYQSEQPEFLLNFFVEYLDWLGSSALVDVAFVPTRKFRKLSMTNDKIKNINEFYLLCMNICCLTFTYLACNIRSRKLSIGCVWLNRWSM